MISVFLRYANSFLQTSHLRFFFSERYTYECIWHHFSISPKLPRRRAFIIVKLKGGLIQSSDLMRNDVCLRDKLMKQAIMPRLRTWMRDEMAMSADRSVYLGRFVLHSSTLAPDIRRTCTWAFGEGGGLSLSGESRKRVTDGCESLEFRDFPKGVSDPPESCMQTRKTLPAENLGLLLKLLSKILAEPRAEPSSTRQVAHLSDGFCRGRSFRTSFQSRCEVVVRRKIFSTLKSVSRNSALAITVIVKTTDLRESEAFLACGYFYRKILLPKLFVVICRAPVVRSSL